MNRSCLTLSFLLTLLVLPTASAQIYEFQPYSTDYFTQMTWNDINRRTAETARSTRAEVSQSQSRPTPVQTANLNFKPTGDIARSKGMQALLAQYNSNQKNEMRSTYTNIINTFNTSVVDLYGIKKNNMATGLAALLTGAYATYTNKTFPDAWVKPLVNQLETSMAQDVNIYSAPNDDKETAYTYFVGIGMVLNLAQSELAKNPNPKTQAQLKTMGAAILKKMLKVEPDRVVFSQNGVSIR